MSNRFLSSSITQKNIRFKLQIGDYTKYVCKGYYTSPEFGEDGSDCKWSLIVNAYDGADHEYFIDVRLKRQDWAAEEQLINVKASIVNCFGFGVLKSERSIFIDGSNEAQILSVAKEQLQGYFGLKRRFYLPNDTLTLQCDLVVYENRVSPYRMTHSLANSDDSHNLSDHYAHSRLVKIADDYFRREIRHFSLHTRGGRTITPDYHSETLGGKWSLVVCPTTDYNSTEYLDVRVMRQESSENQLVKVRLAIIDRSGKVLLSKEKTVYFTSSREVQLLTLSDKTASSWLGFSKKQLISDDTLILHCEMVLYEQTDDSFRSKEEFDDRIKTSGYAPLHFFPYIIAFICFPLPVIMHMVYFMCHTLLPSIWYTILDFLVNMLCIMTVFTVAVFVITLLLIYIKARADEIKRKETIAEQKKKLREERKKMMIAESLEYYTDDYGRNKYNHHRKPQYSNHMINGFYYYKQPRRNNQKYICY